MANIDDGDGSDSGSDEIELRQISISQAFQGPVPPAGELLRYDEIRSGGMAERLVAMAEREQSHRHSVDNRLIEAQIDDDRAARKEVARGQYCGVGVAVTALVCATVVGSAGAPYLAAFLGVGGLSTLITAFVATKIDQRQEAPKKDTEKARPLAPPK